MYVIGPIQRKRTASAYAREQTTQVIGLPAPANFDMRAPAWYAHPDGHLTGITSPYPQSPPGINTPPRAASIVTSYAELLMIEQPIASTHQSAAARVCSCHFVPSRSADQL